MTNGKAPNKKKQRSLFYRVSAWLHLWLGLITGAIMVVVCLCACIWVFNEEITGLLEPETRIAHRNEAVIPPSRLMAIADSLYPGKKAGYATYKQGNAIYLSLGEGRKGNTILRINPYTGQVISTKEHKEGETDFFRFILNGHRFLWLPYEIGRHVVNYSTLIFVIILISGIVLCGPANGPKLPNNRL
ncbi:PepSY domain-containing protein [Niabella sp. W65]|nr:PepSY domain-containing protein [Niabella sp. W65]MCH7361362.1 PepSY domain-containing protein [Niabella sp. W65]